MGGHRGPAASVLVAAVLAGLLALPVHGAGVALAQGELPVHLTPGNGGGLIPYFIAQGVDGSKFRPGDVDLARWALDEWRRSADGVLRFEPALSEDAALIRFFWLPFSEDGALGRMEPLLDHGHTTVSISIRPDEGRFRPSVMRRVREDPLMRDVVLYFVCLHEIGHALGLRHSHNPRDVMWPGANGVTLPVYDRYRHRVQSREDIPRTAWLSHDDVARVRALWEPGPLAQ